MRIRQQIIDSLNALAMMSNIRGDGFKKGLLLLSSFPSEINVGETILTKNENVLICFMCLVLNHEDAIFPENLQFTMKQPYTTAHQQSPVPWHIIRANHMSPKQLILQEFKFRCSAATALR